MIKFNGQISGAAEKHMWKRERRMGVIVTLSSAVIILPFIIMIAFALGDSFGIDPWFVIAMYASVCLIIPLIALIPKSKKERAKFNTCCVFTDEEYIVAVIGNGEESFKLISDAKVLNDYGEFYQIEFPLSKGVNDSFICQKDLLAEGTLEEFESLFEGKLVKKYK